MANRRGELVRGPGACDGPLNEGIALDIDHRPQPSGNKDGVVIRTIYLGELSAAVQSAERLAFKKLLLGGIFFITCVVWRPSAGWRRELNCDSGLVEHVEGMATSAKKKPVFSIVRTNYRCIGDDEQNVLGHGSPRLNEGSQRLMYRRGPRGCDIALNALESRWLLARLATRFALSCGTFESYVSVWQV